ncbi:MAG TPA: asparagine synthase (glutamine-hydrolyzing) [Stellaceae bacterium]|nr:asparagine synthase (glutamine-hydrolyzing) [Stellaceae bacterium]
MCGITGIVDRRGAPVSRDLLRRMTAELLHRGPDSEGYYTDGAVGLGHRRLSIIDLSPAGNQPMATPDGRYVLSYNGEIYNYLELKRELEAAGHVFRSRTDSEVLLHALAAWGEEAILRLNGIFAFALYDRAAGEILLARDRFGVKPLYWCERGDSFLFASEVKALLAHPGLAAALDPAGLVEYLTFQNFLGERTLFKDVRLLPPGCFLRLGIRGDARPRIERYWDFRFADELTGRPEELVEELDRLVQQAVRRQLMSDVPVGAYLSGGIDSGSITAIAARIHPELRTFTVGFDLSSASGLELGFDERAAAEHMSYLCGTEHYEMVLKAGDMERSMRRVVWHMEEPRVGQSYPNFYAAKLASRFCTVALSGAGGDELFGGYPWRYYRAASNSDFDDYATKYYGFWQRLLPAEAAAGIFAPLGIDARAVDPQNLFRAVFGEHKNALAAPEDYINHSLYFEAKTFLHGLLVVEDKLSMAHSLETRVPFLDHDLVDFAMRLPVRMKLKNLSETIRINENEPSDKRTRYFERTRDGKLLLRAAMSRYVPAQIADAVKKGFSAPDASWFRGESMDYVRRTLLTNNARIYDWLDRATVHRLVEDHRAGRENRRLLIWSLLYLETWARTFLDGDHPPPALVRETAARML